MQHVITAMRFARQGQSCTAGSRLYVHRDVFDDFTAQARPPRSARWSSATRSTTRSDIGSLISGTQDGRVCGYLQEALDQGAKPLVGGLPDDGRTGYQHLPDRADRHRALVARRPARRCSGPCSSRCPWDDEDEVIGWANDTHYGLAAFVFTKDLDAALRAAHRIEAGWVQVNRSGGQLPGMSYGGKKQSGIGSEYSIEGALEGFTQRKSITIGIGS